MLTGADPDLIRPVAKYAEHYFKEVRLSAKVLKMATAGKQVKVVSEFDGKQAEELYDRVLISVGRVPNCHDLGFHDANSPGARADAHHAEQRRAAAVHRDAAR